MASDLDVAIRLRAVTRQFRDAIGRASRALKGLGRSGRAAGAEIDAGMSKARRGVESISKQLDSTRRLVRNLVAAYSAFRGVSSVFEAAADMEALQASMRAVTGSAERAREELRFVRDEANRLGLPLQEATRQFLALTAASRGTALEGEQTRQVFSALSEAAVVLGLSNEQLDGALTAVQQIMSKGTVQAEELRGQLGERLFGAFQIAARSIGISTRELGKVLERGLLDSEKFLPVFAAQIRKELGGSVDEASQTSRRALNRLKNAFFQMQVALGQSGFIDAIVDGMRALTRTLSDPAVISGMRKFGALLGSIIRALVENADTVLKVVAALGGAKLGIAAGSLFGPVGGVVGGLLGAGAGFLGAGQITDNLAGGGKEKQQSRIDKIKAEIARLEQQLARETDATARAAIEKTLGVFRRALKQAEAEGKQAAEGAAGTNVDQLRAELKAISDKINRSGGQAAERRLKIAQASAQAELRTMQDALSRQSEALDAALEDRLISIKDYYQRKAELERQAIDAETAAIRKQRALAAEAGNKQAVIQLDAELIRLSREREDVGVRAAREQARAERELRDALSDARDELARITGTDTAEQRREAIARAYRDLRARLQAENDTEGVALIDRLIDVKAAQANLSALEDKWRLTLDRMRNAQEAVRIQQQAGLLTEAQARERIVQLQQQSATELEKLLPLMEQAAQAIGPEAVARVQAWKNELAQTKLVVDEVATRISGQVQDAFASMFEQIGSGARTAKEAFRDFARSVLASINRIASQKLAQALFGSLSNKAGSFFSAIFSGFADGGYVSGPGTSRSDSIPARLSAGEYVVNADAVRKVGVAFLDAINGGAFAPQRRGASLAFAAGGLVPAGTGQQDAQQQGQRVRIVNVIDPALVQDYLTSSDGERTVLNVLQANAGAVKQILA